MVFNKIAKGAKKTFSSRNVSKGLRSFEGFSLGATRASFNELGKFTGAAAEGLFSSSSSTFLLVAAGAGLLLLTRR